MDYLEAKRKAVQELEKKKGKPLEKLVPWKDYDPIMLDNRAYEIMRPRVRWTGD